MGAVLLPGLVATDFSPAVLDTARNNVERQGLTLFIRLQNELGDVLDKATRKALARVVRAVRRHDLAAWEQRHRQLPIVAESVEAAVPWDTYRDSYLYELLYVLERAIGDPSEDLMHVYQFERDRYLGPVKRSAGGEEGLAEMLRGDQAALVARAAAVDRGLAGVMAAVVGAAHEQILRATGGRRLTVALVGDCVMTEIAAFLQPAIRAEGAEVVAHHFYFSSWAGRALSVDDVIAAIEAERFDLLYFSFLTYEGLPLYRSLLAQAGRLEADELNGRCEALLGVIGGALEQVRGVTDIPIVLHGCSGLPLTRARRYLPVGAPFSAGHQRAARLLDAGLREMADGIDNTIFLDEAAVAREVGVRRATRQLVPVWIRRKGQFHPSPFGGLIAERYQDVAAAYLRLAAIKVLLVDFDNTLWAGVMGEGAVVHNRAAQRLLRELRAAGILLVAISKNDPEAIRWEELELSPEDFVLHKISWNPKPRSIGEVAQQLDLDPASFLLIDDNPVERDLVTSAWPTVAALDPADARTWRWLAMLLRFPNTRRTQEAARRTAMYREAAARRDAMGGDLDYAAMMASLDLNSEWRPAGEQDLDRVHELMARTNQFNTTTMRLGKPELAALIRSDATTVWVATLADKFGKLGIVGIVIVRCEETRLVFDAVVMSCRAMGFGLESLLIRGPIDATPGAEIAIGRFVPTARNGPASRLFPEFGFTPEGDEWRLPLDGELPAVPDWLHVTSSGAGVAAGTSVTTGS